MTTISPQKAQELLDRTFSPDRLDGSGAVDLAAAAPDLTRTVIAQTAEIQVERERGEARGIEAHAAGDFILTLTEDLDEAKEEIGRLRERIRGLQAAGELHALANGGCVPKPAYDELAEMLAKVEALAKSWRYSDRSGHIWQQAGYEVLVTLGVLAQNHSGATDDERSTTTPNP